MNILATGINLTTGAASTAATALPTAQNGTLPYRVRVSATANARVRFGNSSVQALATDTLVTPYEPLILDIPRGGVTHAAAIQDTAAGVVNIVPLEDC